MLRIKRYSNRKLYDTEARQYIALEGIAALIRAGQEIQVIDNDSGEDLTSLILSQIIMEQEKKRKGFLPHPVLSALVEAGGTSLKNLRQKLESPLDLLNQVDDEIERRLQKLVQKGELAEEAARQLGEKLIDQGWGWSPHPLPSEETLQRILDEKQIPTRQEIQSLAEQLEKLTATLDDLTR